MRSSFILRRIIVLLDNWSVVTDLGTPITQSGRDLKEPIWSRRIKDVVQGEISRVLKELEKIGISPGLAYMRDISTDRTTFHRPVPNP